MIDGAAPGVGGGDAVGDQLLVQGQIRELALLDSRAGEELIRWLAGRVATCGGRRCGTRPGHRAMDAVRLSRRGAGGCCRARPGGGAGLRWGLGVGHRVAALGGDAEELLQVLAGDQAPPADFDVGQVAAAHLVIEQVAGQAGQPGGLVDGVGQPPAGGSRPEAGGLRRVAAGGGGPRQRRGEPAGPGFRSCADGAGRSMACLPVGRPAFPVVLLAGGPGWEARLIASGPVRPSSAAQLWMCGQSRWRSFRSVFAGEVGEGHGGDGGVAVQGLAGQPGHLPAGAGCRAPGGRCGRSGRWSWWCR